MGTGFASHREISFAQEISNDRLGVASRGEMKLFLLCETAQYSLVYKPWRIAKAEKNDEELAQQQETAVEAVSSSSCCSTSVPPIAYSAIPLSEIDAVRVASLLFSQFHTPRVSSSSPLDDSHSSSDASRAAEFAAQLQRKKKSPPVSRQCRRDPLSQRFASPLPHSPVASLFAPPALHEPKYGRPARGENIARGVPLPLLSLTHAGVGAPPGSPTNTAFGLQTYRKRSHRPGPISHSRSHTFLPAGFDSSRRSLAEQVPQSPAVLTSEHEKNMRSNAMRRKESRKETRKKPTFSAYNPFSFSFSVHAHQFPSPFPE